MRTYSAEHPIRRLAKLAPWLAATTAGLLLSACAGSAHRQAGLDALAEAPVCCETPSDFVYDRLPADGSLEREVGTASEAFRFMGEKSFFTAFELPRSNRPLLVSVEASLPGGNGRDGMFYPAVLFLDEDKNPVSLLPPSEAEYVAADPRSADRLLTEVVVDPRAGWRYFVVFTRPESLKDGMPIRIKSAAFTTRLGPDGQGVVIPVDSDRSGQIREGEPGSPVALIEVAAQELQSLSSRAP